jgi:DNA-binding transcriptional MerR regulator/predicted N-acetyltransferase YhbS
MLLDMGVLSPKEFSRRSGLSLKALRVYEERGLLRPALIDGATGYRQYDVDQLDLAGRIAPLRRAGVSLGDIARFLAHPTAEAVTVWLEELRREMQIRESALQSVADNLAGTQPEESLMMATIRPVASAGELRRCFDLLGSLCQPAFDHTDLTRFAELEATCSDGRDLLLVAEHDGRVIGGALGFLSAPQGVTLRVLAVTKDHRRQGLGRALLAAFEQACLARRVSGIALGADSEAGFFARMGYQTQLLVQWAYAPSAYDNELKALLTGPLAGMDHRQATYANTPQLFVTLDEPATDIKTWVADIATGANVAFCMTRDL